MKKDSTKKDEFGNRVCGGHAQGFARFHSRVDDMSKVVTRIDLFLFGNPERGIDGFIQTDARFKERAAIFMKIGSVIGSAIVAAIIAIAVKIFTKG